VLKNNFAPPGAPVLPVAAVLIFTFYRSTQCTNEWLPPSTAPTPYLCHVCHALMTGPGRPGPAGLDRRPKEPPGARDGRRTAAGAAPAGRGTGLVPGCRHRLRYNDANDSRGLAALPPCVSACLTRPYRVPPQGSAVLARIRWKMQIKSI
jgi:hypothetical protein